MLLSGYCLCEPVGFVILGTRDMNDCETPKMFFHCPDGLQILDELGFPGFGLFFNVVCNDLRVCLDDTVLVTERLHIAKSE